ncbi:hypothetical protein A9K55_004031 [Cordyceps militaris]|uniref:Uncharacterized protein n=1 Tax=Cordyceps militaris TaxID=73501 RepID=A0A2H4SLR9_CORMI|nr:hypothetical protein A9K55_004031 [Cordyceps militaris]
MHTLVSQMLKAVDKFGGKRGRSAASAAHPHSRSMNSPSGYGADGAENNVCLNMCFREVSLCCLRAWPSLAVNYCVCQYRNALGACILASTTWGNRRAQAHGSLICPLMAT